MPSTVRGIFEAAGLQPGGRARWGERVPPREPGVYVVASSEDLDSRQPILARCPIDLDSVGRLLRNRPETHSG